jgi:hypothetical protein
MVPCCKTEKQRIKKSVALSIENRVGKQSTYYKHIHIHIIHRYGEHTQTTITTEPLPLQWAQSNPTH